MCNNLSAPVMRAALLRDVARELRARCVATRLEAQETRARRVLRIT